MLKDLTRKYPDVFTDMPGEIDTPIRCKPYPLPYDMREEVRNEVNSMLEMGVVRPSTSPYASPIARLMRHPLSWLRKKVVFNSVCVDFRKLNKITEVDH